MDISIKIFVNLTKITFNMQSIIIQDTNKIYTVKFTGECEYEPPYVIFSFKIEKNKAFIMLQKFSLANVIFRSNIESVKIKIDQKKYIDKEYIDMPSKYYSLQLGIPIRIVKIDTGDKLEISLIPFIPQKINFIHKLHSLTALSFFPISPLLLLDTPQCSLISWIRRVTSQLEFDEYDIIKWNIYQSTSVGLFLDPNSERALERLKEILIILVNKFYLETKILIDIDGAEKGLQDNCMGIIYYEHVGILANHKVLPTSLLLTQFGGTERIYVRLVSSLIQTELGLKLRIAMGGPGCNVHYYDLLNNTISIVPDGEVLPCSKVLFALYMRETNSIDFCSFHGFPNFYTENSNAKVVKEYLPTNDQNGDYYLTDGKERPIKIKVPWKTATGVVKINKRKISDVKFVDP